MFDSLATNMMGDNPQLVAHLRYACMCVCMCVRVCVRVCIRVCVCTPVCAPLSRQPHLHKNARQTLFMKHCLKTVAKKPLLICVRIFEQADPTYIRTQE